ncbi:glycosyltransferase [Candidatus Pelagibacter bacterium]|nr:glycosyltransferase [Candidatus Pelagibacter bacterium]
MNSKKHVTLLISSLKGGGAEKVCVNIANELANLGWVVNLIVLNLKNSVYQSEVSKKVNLEELNVAHARYSFLALLRFIYKKKPKIFLVFNYELTIIIILLRNLFKFKFKVITRNINTLSEKQKQFDNNWKKKIISFFIKKYYCHADHIINQCQSMHDDLIKIYPNIIKNTSVIYNLLDNHFIDFVSSNDLSQIEKKDYLLCVGRLEKQKAFHYAIEGFSSIAEKFPNLRLKILGEGSLEKELKQQAYRLGLVERIDFEGFKKNIIPYYLNARATLITSIYEGFPNCLIESIKLGTPVLSFDCPSGPREIIVNGINGFLVNYRDMDDFKNKLLTFMESKFYIDKMNTTVKNHEPKEVAKNYEKLLDSFV